MSHVKKQRGIPHYIHGTHASQAKSYNKQPESSSNNKLISEHSKLNRVSNHKKSTEVQDGKKNELNENEVTKLKALVGKQQVSEICKKIQPEDEVSQEKINLLEKSSNKENMLSDEIKSLQIKLQKEEEKIEAYEKQLLVHNIDPITFESLETSEETKTALKDRQRKVQNDVSTMLSGINEMNNRSRQVLTQLKTLDSELKSFNWMIRLKT